MPRLHLPRPLTLATGLALAALLLPASTAHAWSEPHNAITKAALEVLPEWQQTWLGEERQKLIDDYCLIPDHVYTDKANAGYAAMDSQPGVVYLRILHVPEQQAEYLPVIRYFVDRAVAAAKAGNVGDAARYMGTICHQLEDYGSPSHTVPGDNMFTLLQQFLPPTKAMQDQLMHGPIESGEIKVVIADYKPRLLGTTVDEVAWRLMHRVHEGILNARSTTIPIMQALYAEDKDSVTRNQLKAATVDAQVVADALHTILCLGTGKFEAADQQALKTVGIGTFWPVEAASLYYPQAQFFSSPNWGFPRVGVILEGGKKAVPLRLRIAETSGAVEKDFTHGMSAGMGKTLTFPLPAGVYSRFKVYGGLHPTLGARGRVEFTIQGDGKPLATAIVNGSDPAHAFECDVSGVGQLQLTLTSRGLDSKSNYAIWADPVVVKKD